MFSASHSQEPPPLRLVGLVGGGWGGVLGGVGDIDSSLLFLQRPPPV